MKLDDTSTELMRRAGITRAELARQLGLSKAVYNWDELPVYVVAYLRLLIAHNKLLP